MLDIFLSQSELYIYLLYLALDMKKIGNGQNFFSPRSLYPMLSKHIVAKFIWWWICSFCGQCYKHNVWAPPPHPYLEALIPNMTIIFGGKVAVCKLGRESSLGTDSASPTILDISASIIVRNKFLLFKATQLMVFCYGSLSRLGQATCICIILQECSFKAFQTVHSHGRKNIVFKVVPKYSLS